MKPRRPVLAVTLLVAFGLALRAGFGIACSFWAPVQKVVEPVKSAAADFAERHPEWSDRALRGARGAQQVWDGVKTISNPMFGELHSQVTASPFYSFAFFGVLVALVSRCIVGMIWAKIKEILDTPSRPYRPPDQGGVGAEYNAWTDDGILEHYWGEHIHAGVYNSSMYKRGESFWSAFLRATFNSHLDDFKDTKVRFSIDMLRFSGATSPKTILDVGCGIGGSSRILARRFPDATVQGVTLSSSQVKRATELARAQGIHNASFRVCDALDMKHIPDNSQDLVWACESGEHMPDKEKWIKEMTRVLKPGGSLVIAMWCEKEAPHTERQRHLLDYLYDEWAHPEFIPASKCAEMMEATGDLRDVVVEDWTERTIATWRHSIFVGMWNPWRVVMQPAIWYKTIREIWALEKMHEAFHDGAMHYGLLRATKVSA